MKRILSESLPEPGKKVLLSEDEANHAVKVLRLREGDAILLIDGKGHQVQGVLARSGKEYFVQNPGVPIETAKPGETPELTLVLGILKGDAMDWAIEKSTELGVKRLIPLQCERSIVNLKQKGPDAFQERWQRISDQALKQCGRLTRMTIESPMDFSVEAQNLFKASHSFFADEELSRSDSPNELGQAIEGSPKSGLLVLIGPEGGFSDRERALLRLCSKPVHLGPLTLRAETAALYAVSVMIQKIRSHSNS